MKQIYTLLLLVFASVASYAQEVDSLKLEIQRIENSLQYQTGVISLKDGLATITVPKGFKFLDGEQAEYVLTDLWGNPKTGTSLGMLVPEQYGVLDSNSWVFNVEFDEIGYVKDDDANEIDYADLLNTMQEETLEENAARKAEGYEPIQLIGWASTPYYDADQKILHWAKEIKFGEADEHTLNYNVRVLGRKGVLVLNAIAGMNNLPEVQQSIATVTGNVAFESGHSYFDFDPKVDEVAAWTIGGLVAGKMLAKVGFFALLLKFWKVIALAVVAAGSAVMKFLKRRKEATPAEEVPVS
ncbi:DUF2167 domain-containing protein [Pontibacter diazotrophicus]|uniref:DUF2167 domain-containing protein n=1 Tax=Pontibacter diazotrophicus TaxID=1400979 RepID=A0A3D8L6J7_9BACT|nr:DUF2167 domain-containing protein [Pontibacter diazotrophicus]RDV13034.1 DUF2167 domain-containing protein [Pontibacter diazotrophicus]